MVSSESVFKRTDPQFVRSAGGLEGHHREGLAIPLLEAKPSLLPSDAVSLGLS